MPSSTGELRISEDHSLRSPFGELSCESEYDKLGDYRYRKYYYENSKFNQEVLESDVYLIVGRRGSGKTSLSKFFAFQNRIKDAHIINIEGTEDIFVKIQQSIANRTYFHDFAVRNIAKIWEYTIWQYIFEEYRKHDPAIEKASWFGGSQNKLTEMTIELIKVFLENWIHDPNVLNDIKKYFADPVIKNGINKVLEITKHEPLILTIDALERYDKNNEALMITIAGLIQCASSFNSSYSRKGIHLKTFHSTEIFPYIQERVIPNLAKSIRFPLYLHWSTKDLIRFITWRLYIFLSDNYPRLIQKEPDWKNFDEVLEMLWYPYFGEYVQNRNGKQERSYPYIIRHTQGRPRQLVQICNAIARKSLRNGSFPYFYKIDISKEIYSTELDLAKEIINDYAWIYKNCDDIINALRGSPMGFEGKYLDKVANREVSAWPKGEYSPSNFRKLVAELGIVGRVTSWNRDEGIVEANFEYELKDRLGLHSDDLCVIHPMFYRKLDIRKNKNIIIYPVGVMLSEGESSFEENPTGISLSKRDRSDFLDMFGE